MGAERTIDMAEDKNIFFDSYELEQSDLADLADLFKVFGDATRISYVVAEQSYNAPYDSTDYGQCETYAI